MTTTISIQENMPLAPMTTMRTGGSARFFIEVKNADELYSALEWADVRDLPVFALGGGSNTLVPDDGFPGLVIKIGMKGMQYDEVGHQVFVTASAGEVWDDVVQGAVSRGLWGIENLSLIPGTVGGATVQNIGAYGVEIERVIVSVEVFDTLTKKPKTFSRSECAYGYRESIFKKHKNLIVMRTTLMLEQSGTPHVDYEDVQRYFSEKNIISPLLVGIRDAIIAIRTAKMPAQPLGTAGSFFKNPVVTEDAFEDLKVRFPGILAYNISPSLGRRAQDHSSTRSSLGEIKAYLQGDNTVKLSAAWLLDKVGNFRGVRRGDAGVYEKQALILVNHGNASTREIMLLAHAMKCAIKERTNVDLEEEVVMMCE